MSPETSTWRPGLALIYSELGLEQETQSEFERLATHDFADIPRDARWVACLVYLSEVCTFLGDARRAAVLYQCLLPHDGYTLVVGPTVVCYGAAAYYLALLAATMCRWEEAQRHFADALAMNARMGAKPALAHTQYAYAKMLLAREQPDDGASAMSLLDDALAISLELGMHTLEERVVALRARVRSQPRSMQQYPCGLTQREVEVLRLIAVGMSNRDIANALFVSSNTVASHVRSILTKTNTANRTEAAAYARHHNLLAE
jgi:DNA-binding CsgD family transcriptional regulator